jgi:CRP-like cAMP-binding protein
LDDNLEGDIGNCLYIIKEGEVVCISNDVPVRSLKKGDVFGEKSILMETCRSMDVVTASSCIIYSVSIETLKMMVGENYRDILYLNFIKVAFKSSKYLSRFNHKFIEETFSLFEIKCFDAKEVVITAESNLSERINIIIEGGLIDVKG